MTFGAKNRRGNTMRGTELLFGYFLVKVFVCDAEGEPGETLDSLIMESAFNDSKEEDEITESPHAEDKCLGYYDVMGQWDPPFVCRTGSYLYCCGTCGFRFCCAFKSSRLDQTTCKNYDTPPWMMTGRPPPKKADTTLDSTKDKTNLIVYIICGVVAIMALAGIFTKLAIEKTRRPQRNNMPRALAQVIRHPAPEEHNEVISLYGQPYENIQTRAMLKHLQSNQFNNLDPGPTLLARPYPALVQITSPYEGEQPNMDLNKYASLKAVAEKSNDIIYTNRHLAEMTTKGNLPMEPVIIEPEPSNPYSPPKRSSSAQKEHKNRSSKTHNYNSHGSHGNSPNLGANVGMLKSMEGKYSGHRYTHAKKKHSGLAKELHTIHYLPPQPYFVTNSKTEVTV